MIRRQWFSWLSIRKVAPPARNRRLHVEVLEDRRLLATYEVGPGLAYTSLGAVPWEGLGPGDTVQVHWRNSPYNEKVLISSGGTANQPLRVIGLAGPNGERPVIDGQNATTRSQASYPYARTQDRGLITLTRDTQDPYGFKPSYVQIEGLELRNANQLYGFTDAQGATRTFTANAAAVYVERGEHIVVRNCIITGSGNGLFVSSGDDEATISRDILVEGNDFHGNGNAGSDRHHNAYTEASGIVYQYNHFGELRSGSSGIGLKDRSAGTVIRFNWIEGGARLLDLVDPEDSPTLMVNEPNFHQAFVYGNVFKDGLEDAGTLVRYGGDSGVTSLYRKGTLYFYNNTVVVQVDQQKRWNTRLLQLDTNDESVDLHDNVLYVEPATAGQPPTNFTLMLSYGNATIGPNWVSPGWQVSTAYGGFLGTATGTANIINNAGNNPGFVNLVASNFHLANGSQAIDAAVPLPANVANAQPLLRQYVVHQSSTARSVTGAAADLGAFEYSSATSPGVLQFSPATYSVGEAGPTATITVNRTNGGTGAVSVGYATSNGTATAGSDYTAATGTLSWSAGDTASKTFTVPIREDVLVEDTETVNLTLSNPTGGAAVAAPSTATLAIHDNDYVALAPTNVLLTPTVLAGLQQQAQSNTAAWQAFKARLDNNLLVLIHEDEGAYQGSSLAWISDYALGYQILKDSDPVTAAKYADKAIGLIKSGLHDFQKGSWVSRQLLVRGDGTTKTFTLPNADLVPATLAVFLSDVTTKAVVRGANSDTANHDEVDYYKTFLKVSNTSDGAATYREGIDWSHNPNLTNNLIDWSLPGAEPARNSTYYVTETSGLESSRTTNFTLSGRTITFVTAPRTNQSVFVEYIYGTHANDGSTLAYQQTSAGDGGFNSIFVDTTYSSRYLGKHLAMGLDWLDGYVGFSQALKTETMDMLVRWSDFVRDNGYFANNPESNYGAGGYVSRALTALALSPRHSAGLRLLTEVLDYRQQHVLPVLQNPTTSLKGGFWAEGWSYGQLATENLLTAAVALETAGKITATVERQWASEVVQQLVSAKFGRSVYDGGDWYTYPAPFPGADRPTNLFYLLSQTASHGNDRAYANYVLKHVVAGDTHGYIDLLFHDPSAADAFWSALPLQYFASGTGLLTARSDWTDAASTVSVQMGNLLNTDHQTAAPGQIEFQRGDDHLLISSNAAAGPLDVHSLSSVSNVVVVDDNGDVDANGTPIQTYPFSMGFWYGNPGVTTRAYEVGSDYVYVYGDYHAAYSPPDSPGSGGPTSELTRQVVYVRPGYAIVYDRVTTAKNSYPKQMRLHFPNAPTVTGNGFVETVGGSKLFGRTFSTAALSTTVAAIAPNPYSPNQTVHQLITQNSSPAASVRYVTGFQIAPSATVAMDAAQQILSTDNRMEGLRLGNQLVLFGRNGDVNPATAVTYTAPSSSTSLRHLLTNLRAGQAYQVTAGGTRLTTATANSQGTISFTTAAAGSQNVVIAADSPNVVYVDKNNTTGTSDGSATRPFTTVQAAVTAAPANAIIKVAKGDYSENVVVPSKSLQLLGGFAGGTSVGYAGGQAGDFAASNPSANVTRLLGQASAPVIYLQNVTAKVITVDGFTITGGHNGIYVLADYLQYSDVTVAHNIIEGNGPAALQPGGGTYAYAGGGIYSSNATLTVSQNVIRNNNANRGGGMYVSSKSDFTITDNLIENNTGYDDHGGGVALVPLPVAANGNGTFSRNVIRGNVSSKAWTYGWGGGLLIAGSLNPNAIKPVTLSNNVWTDNYAPSAGGAMIVDNGATVILDHELIYKNRTNYVGGAIYLDGDGGGTGSTMSIVNSTIADNTSTQQNGNGVFVQEFSHLTVKNSIFWGNTDDFYIVPDNSGSTITATYTNSQEAMPGTGNRSLDPRFAAPAGGDYHLKSTGGRWDPAANGGSGGFVVDIVHSPAVDAGDPASSFANELTPNGGRINLGTYGNTAQASRSAAIQPVVAFTAASSSGSEATLSVNLAVALSAASNSTVTVVYAVTGGTAAGNGVDFALSSATLIFAPGETAKNVAVAVVNDTQVESNETIQVTISSPANATLGTATTHTFTILDNDNAAGVLAFSSAVYSVGEGGRQALITVQRTGGSAGLVKVNYRTGNGTATAGQDYTATSGTLTFLAGVTSRTFSVRIRNDRLAESNEAVLLTLSNPTGGATLGPASQATLTILDNDARALRAVSPVSGTSTAWEPPQDFWANWVGWQAKETRRRRRGS